MGNSGKPKIKVKTNADNSEVYSLLAFLTKTRYFGEITLFFQNGNVEFMHQKNRLSKSNIKEIAKIIEEQKNDLNNSIKKELSEKQLIFPLFISSNITEVIK